MKQIEETKNQIKEIYQQIRDVVSLNPDIYLMPTELYNAIIKKMGHVDDRIRLQTKSLKMHIKEKQEMARKIKKLEKQIEELHLRLIKK